MLNELCRQLVSMVVVPTPAEVNSTEFLTETTMSSAAERAATSSMSSKWSKSLKLWTVTPMLSLILVKSSEKSLYCKFINVTSGMVNIGVHSGMGG